MLEPYPDVGHVIIDQQEDGMDLANEWGITAVPTLIAVKDREVIGRIVGNITKEQIESYVGPGDLQSDLFQEQSGGSDEGSRPLLCSPGREEDQ